MAIKIGREGYLGIGVETTAGTAVSAVKYLPWTSCTLHNVVEVLDDEAAKGVRERAWGSIASKTRGEGDVTIALDAENAPYLLYPALGTAWMQLVQTGVYQHTITIKAGNPPQTITLNYYDGVETRQYTYGTVNTFELTFSDGWAEVTAGILSKAGEAGSATRSITEERVLAFKDANIYFGTDLAQANRKYANGTSDATKLSAFTLTINNNAEAQYCSGSSSPAQISIGQFEVGGNYTLFFENKDEREAHENQTKRAMVVVFTGDDIGASSQEKIIIEIPEFHITDRGIDTAPAGFMTENPTFVADISSTNGTENESITVKIINTEDQYGAESSSSSASSSSSFSSSSSSCSSCSSCSSSCSSG